MKLKKPTAFVMNKLFCFLILTIVGCNDCEYPVSFEVALVPPETKLTIELDDGRLFDECSIADGFGMDIDHRLKLVTDYCTRNDSLKVRIMLNDHGHDTTFFINQREINDCFI